MDKEEIKLLIEKYLNGTASVEESALVENWYNTYQEEANRELTDNMILDAVERISMRLHITKPETKMLRILPRIAAAASIVFFLGIGFYFYKASKNNTIQLAKSVIKPGASKAQLVLADGTRIMLDSAGEGMLAKQSGVRIEKGVNGEVTYIPEGKQGDEIQYNLMETPRGGTYQLRLPDGTKVWLNAASSLRYPVSFTGRAERRVELTGEGYFEVSKDKEHPFLVASGNQQVEVLGTHFNINSYREEGSIKTTLLEGSVAVSSGQDKVTLKPDQQAILSGSGIKVVGVLAESFTDWKSGEFYFRKEGLQSIMRKLSRWYDVEVEYAPSMKSDTRKFSGTLSRYDDILKVLNAMEKSEGLQFKIEGRKVTVLK